MMFWTAWQYVVLMVALALVSPVSPAWSQVAPPEGSGRLAMGLIVKLKGDKPMSMVRLQASQMPKDGRSKQRLRLAWAAQRRGVSFDVQRDTAFAAHVIHSRHPIPVGEAQRQAALLRADPDVEWVIVNEIEKPAAVTVTDPQYASQTWLQARASGLEGVGNIKPAWDLLDDRIRTSGHALSPVVVAVLDSGYLPHPDLANRLLPGYDFVSESVYSRDADGRDPDASDPGNWLTDAEKAGNPVAYGPECEAHDSSWHGLTVMGMLAAGAGNNLDGAGMLWQLPNQKVVLPVRVAGICGADVSDIIEGMLWAAGVPYQGSPAANPTPARVINLSFGGDGSCTPTPPVRDGAWLYTQTIELLRSKGVLVVASAGNGDEVTGFAAQTRPGNCRYVLTATGLNRRGYKAQYANLVDGTTQTAVAVASGDGGPDQERILTTFNAGLQQPAGYIMGYGSGTSYAAPTVAGVAAMMLAANPDLTVDQLLQGITSNASPHVTSGFANCSATNSGHCTCTTRTCGSGILNAYASVNWALTTPGDGVPPNNASATFLQPAPASSSGGGGALDLGILIALLLWTMGLLAWRKPSNGLYPRDRARILCDQRIGRQ